MRAQVNGSVFGKCVSAKGRGGIDTSGTMTMTNRIGSGNRDAEYGNGGGGIYNSGRMTLTNSIISGNSVSELGGGGIYNASGTMTLMNSTVSGNTASGSDGGGGGISSHLGWVSASTRNISGSPASCSARRRDR